MDLDSSNTMGLDLNLNSSNATEMNLNLNTSNIMDMELDLMQHAILLCAIISHIYNIIDTKWNIIIRGYYNI